MFENFMQKFVRWLDPKLEKYRPRKIPSQPPKPPEPPKYTPETLADFIDVLKRTPRDVISNDDRARIAAIMSFDTRKVSDLMVKKKAMVFVKNTEVLGPLVLDKLYKSGFTHFPVVDSHDKVKGIIHTDSLNFAVQEIERLGSYYFLVLDSHDALAGFFTTQMLLDYLLRK